MKSSDSEQVQTHPHQILSLETNQPSELVSAVKRILFQPTINTDSTQDFHSSYTYMPLRQIVLNYIEFEKDTSISLSIPDSLYVVEKILSGNITMKHGNQNYLSPPGQANCLLPGVKTDLECSGNVRAIIVTIERKTLEKQLENIIGLPLSGAIQFETAMSMDSGAIKSWWRLINTIENEFKHSDSLFIDGACVNKMEQIVLQSLLYCQPHNYSQWLTDDAPAVAPAHVRRAEVFMQSNLQHNISLEDIVSASNVPERTLLDAFKKFRGISPMQFLKMIRLQSAREELLDKKSSKNLTDVAHHWGFNHTGRFSIDYKARYGESPSDTLRKKEQDT